MKPKIPICDSENLIPETFSTTFLNWPSSPEARKRKNQHFKIPYALACCVVKDQDPGCVCAWKTGALLWGKGSLNLTCALGMASACQFTSVWAWRTWISRPYSTILASRHDVSPHPFPQIAEQRKIIAWLCFYHTPLGALPARTRKTKSTSCSRNFSYLCSLQLQTLLHKWFGFRCSCHGFPHFSECPEGRWEHGGGKLPHFWNSGWMTHVSFCLRGSFLDVLALCLNWKMLLHCLKKLFCFNQNAYGVLEKSRNKIFINFVETLGTDGFDLENLRVVLFASGLKKTHRMWSFSEHIQFPEASLFRALMWAISSCLWCSQQVFSYICQNHTLN